MTAKFCAALLLVLAPRLLVGQTGFEDSEGKTSVILEMGTQGKINVSDKRIEFGLVREISDEDWRIGGSIAGKPTEGFAPIFADDDFAAEAEATLSLGYRRLFAPDRDIPPTGLIIDDWATVRVGNRVARYEVLAGNGGTAEQHDFCGLNAELLYNVLLRNNFFLGVSGGVEQQNNYGGLRKVTVVTQREVQNENGTTTLVERRKDLREGTYEENTEWIANLDFIWIPNFLDNRVGFDALLRYDAGRPSDEELRPGLGIFFTQKGAPTRVVGGISFEVVDDELKVGLVGGFKF
jgi:hypothetical protein